MTAIVAHSDGRTIFVAADSATCDGHGRVFEAARPKVLRKTAPIRNTTSTGDLIIGFAGESAIVAHVRAHWIPEVLPDPADDDDCDAWAQTVAEAVTELVHDAVPKLAADGYAGLLCYAGRLWALRGQVAIRTRAHSGAAFDATGSGGDLALGAIHALEGLLEPGQAVVAAINAACRYDDGCRPPIHLELLAHPED